MHQPLNILDRVRIASPCPVSWVSMEGDDRVRHCEFCRLNVYNLSDMTRVEAEQFIGTHEGQLCLNYFQRADGTILTADCPSSIRSCRRRGRWLIAASVAATLAFINVTSLFGVRSMSSRRLSQLRPIVTVCRWVESKVNPPATTVWPRNASSIRGKRSALMLKLK